MNFDLITIIAIFTAFALGGILKGATGAGAPIITIPVIAAFYDVRIAVIIMVIPNLLTNIGQLYQFRKRLRNDNWKYLKKNNALIYKRFRGYRDTNRWCTA